MPAFPEEGPANTRLAVILSLLVPVPPNFKPKVPLVILDAERFGISLAAKISFLPISPPPRFSHAWLAVVAPVPPLLIETVFLVV